MENKPEPPPSQTIKDIEQSLLLLKSKIQTMQKEEARNIANIDKAFSSSIPILKNKFNQTQNMMEMEKKKHLLKSASESKFKQINESKYRKDKQINKNRQQLMQVKATQSHHIKEMSRRNDEIIENVRRKYRNQNRKKKENVEESKLRSKEKVQIFHIFKKYDIRKRKKQQSQEIARRLKSYHKEVETLEKEEKEAMKKMQKTQVAFRSLRNAMEKLSKMKEPQFMKLLNYVGIDSMRDIKQEAVDKILNVINAQREERSHSQTHDHLY